MSEENVIRKIKALRDKIPENGATEDEAFAALAKADELMTKYGITEEQLQNIEFKRDMREGSFEQRQKQMHPSQKFCGQTIAEFCGIRIWNSWVTTKKKYSRLFGLREDVEMAEFLLGLIHDSMDRGWKEFLATSPKKEGVSRHTEYWSFMMAFGVRVNEKIEELMTARVEAQGTGTDLVETKMALVEKGMEVMLPNLKLKAGRSRGIHADGDAWDKGTAAGDKVNIQRPLTKAGHGPKQLK